jgi:hypothetical protein
LDFRLPWPAKLAVECSAPEKWGPFENNLPVTWNTSSFDRTYLGFPSINLDGFFTKTKEAISYFVIFTILDYWRTVSGHAVQDYVYAV